MRLRLIYRERVGITYKHQEPLEFQRFFFRGTKFGAKSAIFAKRIINFFYYKTHDF